MDTNEKIYHVVFPTGETRGPLSLREIKDQTLQGLLPRDSRVRGKLGVFSVLEVVAMAVGQPLGDDDADGPRNSDGLVTTRASTPHAMKQSDNDD